MNPMLCSPLSIDDAHKLVEDVGAYIVEEKMDGVRAYIKHGQLYDRRGANITKRFPEFIGIDKLHGFDGEIVVEGKEFGDVAGRMHLRDVFQMSLLAKKCPASFIAFDYFPLKQQLKQRRAALNVEVGNAKCSWLKEIEYVVASPCNLEEMWNGIVENVREGVVVKLLNSYYQEGKRSTDWYKVKAWCEATAIFTKLEQHNKGVRLETVDGRSVNVNGGEANEVKRIFDKTGSVVCEVQYLPQKNSDSWRFPSFRSIVNGGV